MLRDGHGRSFEYLRLSVTKACNFRCAYCLPTGYKRDPHDDAELNTDEVRRLIAALASAGMWKVRFTGGEPLLRQDLVELIAIAKATPGVRRVALSTNGFRLGELLPELQRAGLSHLNVSVDSLDPAVFARLTGHDRLPALKTHIARARALGLVVKLNAVLLAGVNDGETDAFCDFAAEHDVGVRFIELMQTADAAFFSRHHLRAADFEQRLLQRGYVRTAPQPGDGPATVYMAPSGRGSVGVITPYAEHFCDRCNRLRVDSTGKLKLCLFAEHADASLREFLQRDGDGDALLSRVRALLRNKAPTHHLHEGRHGRTHNLSVIGG